MSKSVTVIHGSVWSQNSFTWDGNIDRGNTCGDKGIKKQNQGRHNGPNQGQGPDDCNDGWDTIEEGRNFLRRTRTN